MTPDALLHLSLLIAEILLVVAMLITVIRIILGPTLADRVLGLDMLVAIGIGFIALLALDTGFAHAMDIAMALSVAGFLATLAFARYISARGKTEQMALEEQTRKMQKNKKAKGKKR